MSIKILTAQILKKIHNITKGQGNFMLDLFCILLTYRRRHNFGNLSRYGSYHEQSYRACMKGSLIFLASTRN